MWATERGAWIAETSRSEPWAPGERLLHRLARTDVGHFLEVDGYAVFTEGEVRTAESVGVPTGA
ncbi:hypothetical protein [Streptomyces monomycini]|uniref:hypothetical protein n=1 Tax=Streptomyces monomycini TaxID=371720 RepID=UPI0004AAE49E|nr:hypothetical protein [Streptomyces monomycini]